MFIIYGSHLCPDCVACKANFDFYGVKYEFRDVTLSLPYLKDFIKLRENNPKFDHAREVDDIGLPALIDEDNTVLTSWETWMAEQHMKVLDISTSATACNLDHKGC